MSISKSVKIDDDTWNALQKYKDSTGIPVTRIIKEAVNYYLLKKLFPTIKNET